MRVLIMKDIASFNLYVKGGYEIRNRQEKDILAKGKSINGKVSVEEGGINVSGIALKDDTVVIVPQEDNFYINNRPLRGGLIIKRAADKKLLVINSLDLEDYTRGVLANEVSHHWPKESLKAQAVATRTYALYQIEASKGKDYDVTSDIYSQVYTGKNAERYRTNYAVNYTKGLVLTYKGKIFPAYFHATCGGKTEDADELWKTNLAPLKSVDCGFCTQSPHFKWQKVLAKSVILEKLNSAGRNLSSLENIQILERDRSGRIKRLKLFSNDAQEIVSAKDFRQIIGPRDIRSTNFTLTIAGDKVYFEGFGWGHGVGLCQWGAYFASRKGYKYQDILKLYYPGAKIEKR